MCWWKDESHKSSDGWGLGVIRNGGGSCTRDELSSIIHYWNSRVRDPAL